MCLSGIEIWSAVARNVALAVGSIGTLTVAIVGLTQWRREFVGKRDTELCEEALDKFYQAQEAIRWMRSPISFSSEMPDRDYRPGEGDPEQEAKDKASVLFYRYEQNKELFSSIHALRYRFMARFGREAGEPFEELHRSLHRLFGAARVLSHLWARRPDHFRTDEQRQEHFRKVQEKEELFWSTGDDDDELEKEVAQALEKLEVHCRQRIKG